MRSKACRASSHETAFVDNQRALRIEHLQIALRLAAAEDGFHASDHFARAVRLADIIVGADFEPQQTVDLFGFGVTITMGTSENDEFPGTVGSVGTGSIRSSRIRSGGVWRT